jgi:predicted DNA-binding protein (UPF0278 family)
MKLNATIKEFIRANLHQLRKDYRKINQYGFLAHTPTFDSLFDCIEANGGDISSMIVACQIIDTIA